MKHHHHDMPPHLRHDHAPPHEEILHRLARIEKVLHRLERRA